MRSVLLYHQPDPLTPAAPTFDAHFDWLVELLPVPNPDARAVPTWRLGQRPDYLTRGRVLQATAIAPHRAFYLDLLAPRRLSGGRGLVYPVARGTIAHCQLLVAGGCEFEVRWSQCSQQLAIAPDGRISCRARVPHG